jgi:hypothetical protein
MYHESCNPDIVIMRNGSLVFISVSELHHDHTALALGKNFDAAPAPVPTLLYSKVKSLKPTKVEITFLRLSCAFDSVLFTVLYIAENMNLCIINRNILCHFSIPNHV